MSYTVLSKLFYSDSENYKKIYEDRFNGNNTIHFDFEINGNPAFVVITLDIWNKMLSIYKKDKKIGILCNILPGLALEYFEKRCLVDEIIISNNIEGVHSSRKEIRDILDKVDDRFIKKRFRGLVLKYFLLHKNEEMSFTSCQDIRNLYNDLVYDEIAEDDPDNLPDGKIFRKHSTSVLSETQKEIHRGITSEANIIAFMNKALDLLNDETLEVLIRISVFHYLFGYIHPFYDGNGRTSRFISSYLLSKHFETILGYRLSFTIKENLSKYYDAFSICNNARNLGDLTPFVNMFINIIDISMEQLINALEERHQLLEKYKGAISLLPNGDNDKYADLYFYLIQASLFADQKSGITRSELTKLMNTSANTTSKRLESIDKKLLIINKQDKAFCYRLNLDEFNKIILNQQ